MDLRGWLETDKGVDANGFPARYQEGAYCEYADREDRIIYQSGWYRRSFQAFVPMGTEAFYIAKNQKKE